MAATPARMPPDPITTPSQTVGPFFALPDGLLWADGPEVVGEDAPGALLVRGRVIDGAGEPVPDAMVETWQADERGRFPADGETAFRGLGRCGTDAEGVFWIRTVKPSVLPTPSGDTEAPHINVSVLARGLLKRLVTRIYFPEEQAANEADPVLSTVDSDRRGTLLAVREGEAYRFDIRLQGESETVFFEL